MKKLMMVLAALVALALTGCNAGSGKIADLKGEWNIYEANGFSVENPEALLSFNPETGVVYGWLGCNAYQSSFDLNEAPGEIELESGITTLMSCDRIEQEQAIASALDRAEHFRLSADKQELTLFADDKVVVLKLRKVSDELPELGKYATPVPVAEDVNVAALVASTTDNGLNIEGAWKLEKLQGVELNSAMEELPFIDVDTAKKSVSGLLGCNTFNARIELEDQDKIDIDNIGATRTTCEFMEVERAFAEALDEADRFAFDPANGNLVLLTDEGKWLAVFSRK